MCGSWPSVLDYSISARPATTPGNSQASDPIGNTVPFEAGADFLKMFGELCDAGEKFLRGFGDFAGVFGLRMLLPTHTHRTQNCDERRWRGNDDAFVLRPNHQVVIAFERSAKK